MKGGRLRPPSPFHIVRANSVEGRENIESSQAPSFSRRLMEAALPRGGNSHRDPAKREKGRKQP